jgi:hypothetical protein
MSSSTEFTHKKHKKNKVQQVLEEPSLFDADIDTLIAQDQANKDLLPPSLEREEETKEQPASHSWVSTIDTASTAVVPAESFSWDDKRVAVVQQKTTATDFCQELCHMLGCTNIFIKDVNFGNRDVKVTLSMRSIDNEFLKLTITPFIKSRFMNEPVYGTLVLLPPMVVSDAYMAPHGNIDELPDPVNPDRNEYLLKDKADCAIKMSFRPSAWNRFTQTDDGEYDALALNSLGYLNQVFEPKVKSVVDAFFPGESWSSCVHSKKDVNSHGIHSKVGILRKLDPENADIADIALVKQLEDRTYRASTQVLTDICIKRFAVEKDFIAYRLTSANERKADPDCPLYKQLTKEQTTVPIKGHLVFPLISLGALRKAKKDRHVTTNLRSYIWLGEQRHYGPMKQATVEELLKYVPDYPAAPTKEELFNRPELEDQLAEFKARLAQSKKKRERE